MDCEFSARDDGPKPLDMPAYERHLLLPDANLTNFGPEREFDGRRISCGLLEYDEFGPRRGDALGL